MSKKTNSIISEDIFKCKIKTLHTIETKWGIRICCQARILTLCSNLEKVRNSLFKKYLEVPLVFKL